MKKLFALSLVLILALALLTACGTPDEGTVADAPDEDVAVENVTDENTVDEDVVDEDAAAEEKDSTKKGGNKKGAKEDAYSGFYLNGDDASNSDTVNLTLCDDGSYTVDINLFSLSELYGSGNIVDDAIEFVVEDPNCGDLSGIFYPEASGETYSITITDSQWEPLETGSVIEGFVRGE